MLCRDFGPDFRSTLIGCVFNFGNTIRTLVSTQPFTKRINNDDDDMNANFLSSESCRDVAEMVGYLFGLYVSLCKYMHVFVNVANARRLRRQHADARKAS